MILGHKRKKAFMLAYIKEFPCIVKELNDKLPDESKKLNISKNINILLIKRKVNIFYQKKDIFLELNRIGNNLNQLTKLTNSHITNIID